MTALWHTPHRLRESLRSRLAAHERTIANADSGVPSAVLLALFEQNEATHLWLVRRSAELRAHSGQVALPGGKRDAADESFQATALREAEEEIGLSPSKVELLGLLDDLVTGTGFVITPVVAWITAPFTPQPNAIEVARVFSAPVSVFAAGDDPNVKHVGYEIDGEYVWGATSAIARRLVRLIADLG